MIPRYVNPDLSLTPEWATKKIHPGTVDTIKRAALDQLGRSDPLLPHICDVRVVCNPRRNYINVSIKNEYVTLIHRELISGVHYCFFMSDKIEPYVIITALDARVGRLVALTKQQIGDVTAAVGVFKAKYHISNESYHYTGIGERMEGYAFSRNTETKSHSSHWHLKMRVSTKMCTDILPVMGMLNIEQVKATIEPIRYGYSREGEAWDAVYLRMLKETE